MIHLRMLQISLNRLQNKLFPSNRTGNQNRSATRNQNPSATRNQNPSATRSQNPSATRNQNPSATRSQNPSATSSRQNLLNRLITLWNNSASSEASSEASEENSFGELFTKYLKETGPRYARANESNLSKDWRVTLMRGGPGAAMLPVATFITLITHANICSIIGSAAIGSLLFRIAEDAYHTIKDKDNRLNCLKRIGWNIIQLGLIYQLGLPALTIALIIEKLIQASFYCCNNYEKWTDFEDQVVDLFNKISNNKIKSLGYISKISLGSFITYTGYYMKHVAGTTQIGVILLGLLILLATLYRLYRLYQESHTATTPQA